MGHIGLASAMTARALGAGLVITVKARPGGEEMARRAGSDVVLNVTEHDIVAEVRQLTRDAGADCVVEASGAVDSFPLALAATRVGGVVAVLSSYSGDADAQLSIPLAEWGWGIGDKTILSTFQRSGSERVARLLRLVGSGRVDPTMLLTDTYEFGQADQALADLAERKHGLIKPHVTF
jgi:threonine dehydrogenase-like Zn-dependent dehydrogenase